MRTSRSHYTIVEHQGFSRGVEVPGCRVIPPRTFDALESLVLAHLNPREAEPTELFALSAWRGVKLITARNYVGTILLDDGTTIDILPKIAGEGVGIEQTKRIFYEMLSTLREIPFKKSSISRVDAARLSLLEVFISMFLDEVTVLTKQGLRSAYQAVEGNERFYRGRLVAAQNIKHNLVNKARFFVCYDDFNLDRPENRLIKLLMRKTRDSRNRQSARQCLSYFSTVNYSSNYAADFASCVVQRTTSHYQRDLAWCEVFLGRKSFTAFSGRGPALALLFPMEKVFESYAAAKLRRHLAEGMKLYRQDRRYSRFTQPKPAFRLCPGLVLEWGGRTAVLDTKWKLLRDGAPLGWIGQCDMYQMYAYGKKYGAEKVVLIYPRLHLFTRPLVTYSSEDDVQVCAFCLDLTAPERSLAQLLAFLTGG